MTRIVTSQTPLSAPDHTTQSSPQEESRGPRKQERGRGDVRRFGEATVHYDCDRGDAWIFSYVVQAIDFGPALGFATKQYGVPRTFGFDFKIKY
jgi:hypothetical protein